MPLNTLCQPPYRVRGLACARAFGRQLASCIVRQRSRTREVGSDQRRLRAVLRARWSCAPPHPGPPNRQTGGNGCAVLNRHSRQVARRRRLHHRAHHHGRRRSPNLRRANPRHRSHPPNHQRPSTENHRLARRGRATTSRITDTAKIICIATSEHTFQYSILAVSTEPVRAHQFSISRCPLLRLSPVRT